VLRSLLLIALLLIALALHEAAHVIIATAFGVRVKRFGIGWRGPFIVRESGEPRANLYIAIAGPITNVILAILFWTAAPTFAHINLVLGLSNLIPIQGSDGSRAWAAIRELKMRRPVAVSLE
jgi:Zn-dependent protease